MNKGQMENLLAAIEEIVAEDTMRWTEKRDLIKARLKETERYETAFWEFIEWFRDGEEDQPETTGEEDEE